MTSVVIWLLLFFQNQLSRLFYIYIFGSKGINIINKKINPPIIKLFSYFWVLTAGYACR
jgi:hypothetical protein